MYNISDNAQNTSADCLGSTFPGSWLEWPRAFCLCYYCTVTEWDSLAPSANPLLTSSFPTVHPPSSPKPLPKHRTQSFLCARFFSLLPLRFLSWSPIFEGIMSLSPDSSFEAPPLDNLSNIASNKSTPPTTVADSASLHSDTSKHDVNMIAVDSSRMAPQAPMEPEETQDEDADTPSRARRTRGNKPQYNLAVLTGTDGHGKREAKGDYVSARNQRRRTVAADKRSWSDSPNSTPERKASKARRETIDALIFPNSPDTSESPRARRQRKEAPRPVRASARQPAPPPSPPTARAGVSTRRTRKTADIDMKDVPRELRRLEDTKEFSHVDDRPVVYTVWSNGRYIDSNELKKKEEAKKAKTEVIPKQEEKEGSEPVTNIKKRRVKKYLDKGLYAGQDAPMDIGKGLTPGEKKKLGSLPELLPAVHRNKTFPSPMFTGLRTLINGRDFRLPYQICNPLPPGQPKPDEWKKMTKSMQLF